MFVVLYHWLVNIMTNTSRGVPFPWRYLAPSRNLPVRRGVPLPCQGG